LKEEVLASNTTDILTRPVILLDSINLELKNIRRQKDIIYQGIANYERLSGLRCNVLLDFLKSREIAVNRIESANLKFDEIKLFVWQNMTEFGLQTVCEVKDFDAFLCKFLPFSLLSESNINSVPVDIGFSPHTSQGCKLAHQFLRRLQMKLSSHTVRNNIHATAATSVKDAKTNIPHGLSEKLSFGAEGISIPAASDFRLPLTIKKV
jgi:hypothetical protein